MSAPISIVLSYADEDVDNADEHEYRADNKVDDGAIKTHDERIPKEHKADRGGNRNKSAQ